MSTPNSDDIQPTNSRFYEHPSGEMIARVQTSGSNNEILHIGNTKVHRDSFVAAFGGTLNPGLVPAPSRKFGNPSPLGLSALALTIFVFSLANIRARGVQNPSVVIGLAFFYGGFTQLAAGMWEIVVENTFPAVMLSSLGGFWMSWAALESNSFGIAESYSSSKDFDNMVGFYLLGWAIFMFMLTTITLRSTLAFFGLFLCLDFTFIFLAAGKFASSVACTKIGGYFGLVTACLSWYNAYAGLATKENSYFVPKPVFMPGAVTYMEKND